MFATLLRQSIPKCVYKSQIYNYLVVLGTCFAALAMTVYWMINPVQAQPTNRGSISGQISSWSGAPLGSLQITTYQAEVDVDDGSIIWVSNAGIITLNEDGTYVVSDLSVGSYQIQVFDLNFPKVHVNQFYQNGQSHESATDIVVDDGQHLTDIDIELQEYGKISGKVTTTDGQPLEGIPVQIYERDNGQWEERQTVETAADGTYVLTTSETLIPRNENARIRVGPDTIDQYTEFDYVPVFYGNTRDVESAADIPVSVGTITSGIDVQLARAGRISGRVTFANPGGDVSPLVSLYALDTCCNNWVLVDTVLSDPEYLFLTIPAGSYRVGATAAGYTDKFYNGASSLDAATDIVITDGEAINGVDVELLDAGENTTETPTSLPTVTPTAPTLTATPTQPPTAQPTLAFQGAEFLLSSQQPLIDGEVEESWQNALSYPINNLLIGDTQPSESDLSGSFRGLYNDTMLYLLVEVTDEDLQNDSDEPWLDDAVEFFIDGDLSGGSAYDGADDRHIVVRWNDASPHLGLNSAVLPSGMEQAVAPAVNGGGSGYVVEVAVPLAELNISSDGESSFGLEIHINDDDDGGDNREHKLAWSAEADESWFRPNTFGLARLTMPTPTATMTPTPLPTATPTVMATVPTNTDEQDDDQDGIPNSIEGTGDIDGDGIVNSKDLDSDGDGILDSEEGLQDANKNGIADFVEPSYRNYLPSINN